MLLLTFQFKFVFRICVYHLCISYSRAVLNWKLTVWYGTTGVLGSCEDHFAVWCSGGAVKTLHQKTVNLHLLNTAEVFVFSGTEDCISHSKKRWSFQPTATRNNGYIHWWKTEKNHPLCNTVHAFFAWRHNCVYWLFLLTRSATEQLNLAFNQPLNSRLITEHLNLTFSISLNFRLILWWDWKCPPVSDLTVICSLETNIYHIVCTSQLCSKLQCCVILSGEWTQLFKKKLCNYLLCGRISLHSGSYTQEWFGPFACIYIF